MKKNKKLLISIIVLVILIVIVGVAYAFVATDMFKSDKDQFFKYASQLFNKDNSFFDSKIDQYNQKKSNSKYEFIGELTAEIDSDDLDKTKLKNLENINLSFAGNVDEAMNKAESLVKLNYSNDINFSVLFKRINGVTGIKINDVTKKYLAVKDNELMMLPQKFIGNIPFDITSVDFSRISLSSEDNDNTKNKLIQIFKDNLDGSKFSKVKSMNSEGYCLEITNQKIIELMTKVLESLKTDEQSLNKINSILGTNLSSNNIDFAINYLSSITVKDSKSRITIYQKDGKLNKVEIQFNDMVNITITKTSTEDDVNYNIYAETQHFSVNFDAKFSGLKNLKSIKENYSLEFLLGNSYKYNVVNTVNFTDDIEIKDFETNEYTDLNKMNKEQLTKLYEAMITAINNVHKEKLEKAGLQTSNPLDIIIPDFSKLASANSEKSQLIDDTNTKNTDIKGGTDLLDELTNKGEENNTSVTNNSNENNPDNTNKQNDNNSNTDENNKNSSSSNIVENMEKVEKESYNARFTQYEGNSVRGTTVKSLIMQIIATNMADEQKKIKVTGDITLTGDEIPDSIDTSKSYKVKCSIGIDGYVESVEIKEN